MGLTCLADPKHALPLTFPLEDLPPWLLQGSYLRSHS